MFVISNLEIFNSRNHQHPHFTRNSSGLRNPNHSTSFSERAAFYSCITLFNSQPIDFKSVHFCSRGRCLGDNFYGTSYFTVSKAYSPLIWNRGGARI